MSERDNLIYKAKLAEQAERYDEMVTAMKEVASMDAEMSVEERNLLSVAYKNVMGARRASWRIIRSIEQKLAQREAEDKVAMVKEYREQVEKEMKEICEDVFEGIVKHLLPSSTTSESKIFYYKVKGDYLRYIAEFSTDTTVSKEAAENSLAAYKAASDVAKTDLPPTHPIRLGLALNFSVFYYEIMNSPSIACKLAKAAFDDAIVELDKLQGESESYKDSTLIMQLLMDNITLWTSDMEGETKEGGKTKESGISNH